MQRKRHLAKKERDTHVTDSHLTHNGGDEHFYRHLVQEMPWIDVLMLQKTLQKPKI